MATFNVSADPVDFDEAIAYFRKRVPLTDAEWKELYDTAHARAFTVANVLQFDVVLQVWDAVDRAIANGTTLDDFLDEVVASLLDAWQGEVKNPAWRLETIFRTNVLGAYAAGRYRQATDPTIKKARPFWMYNAVLDDRTTQVCADADGTVLPADHAWWRTHYPLCHFNCRSNVMTLTDQQAERIGVTKSPTTTEAADGFGKPPAGAVGGVIEAGRDDAPKPLRSLLARKLKKTPKPTLTPPDDTE